MENIEWLELYFKTMKIYSKNNIKEAAEVLKNGGLIAFPTETVFGLGVIFNNELSYKRLIDVKIDQNEMSNYVWVDFKKLAEDKNFGKISEKLSVILNIDNQK